MQKKIMVWVAITHEAKPTLIFIDDVKINDIHRASATQQRCQDTFPGFMNAQEWPSNSRDLNPVDYSVWSISESKVCSI
ncbi:unnamed protein product [Haemonchus placei]|uniref:DDE_3 domain-containing protein n=1 Tax=Haemonchus placei TaxID=6290 RepID=A0A0N4WFC4_HAEPC|nr:unnamed protein product [Haemonchus placei]